jgi:hypothetical protein
MKKIETPELDKLVKVSDESQKIGEFLEWLSSQEIELAEWTGSCCDECGDETLMNIIMTREQLLAKYFCIDLVKAEKERQAILDNIRRENEQ